MLPYSTPESVEKGEPTILAIVETVFAVIFYWGIAWYWNTHIHLLTSIIVAPLLLLRSEQSTEKGVKWFGDFLEDDTEITLRETPIRFLSVILMAGTISYFCASELAQHLLLDQTGWSLFARSLLIGFASFIIAVAVAVAVAGAGAVAVAVAGAVAGAGAVAVAGAVAGAGAVAVAVAVAVYIIFIIPFASGILFRSLLVRTLATTFHPIAGLKCMPDNWRKIIWAIDSRHHPELVPDLAKRTNEFSLHYLLENINSKDLADTIVGILMFPIIMLPAIFYRWSLKSTCWLYLPLLYIVSGVRGKNEEEKSDYLLDTLKNSRKEIARIFLSLLIITSTIVSTISIEYLLALKQSYSNIPIPVYILAFNIFDLAPWQWLSFVGAVFTWIIFFAVDRVISARDIRKKHNPDLKSEPFYVHGLFFLSRVRTVFSVFAVIMAFVYAVLVLNDVYTFILPEWLSFLDRLYGPYLLGGVVGGDSIKL
ncbi:MAG: hypothetical protein HQL69_23615 [Magnetococcales bacterium]|nr:hypothetical protein [Magnetococcales bacterium]